MVVQRNRTGARVERPLRTRAAWAPRAAFLLLLAVAATGCLSGSQYARGTGRVTIQSATVVSNDAQPAVETRLNEGRFAPLELPSTMDADVQEVIVKLKSGRRKLDLERIATKLRGHVRKADEANNLYVVKLSEASVATVDAVYQLSNDPSVEYVEPNYPAHVFATPNDQLYDLQWNLRKISLPQAWDKTKGSTQITVAILDTGVQRHEDLPSQWNWAPGYDVVGNDTDPTDPGSTIGSKASHGTAVAGVIGAVTNNIFGIAGVAWNVKLMAVRVMDQEGEGYASDIADGIDWAVDNGADVINLSLGLKDCQTSKAVTDALNYAYRNNVVVVAAAGNDGKSCMGSPANHPNVISVGAITQNGSRASYSNYGSELDLWAPGGEAPTTDGIWSTWWSPADADGSVYGRFAGTSFAAPHVTGVVALMMATGMRGPDYIRTVLTRTATPLNGSGTQSGYGLVNAAAAVNAQIATVFAAQKEVDQSGTAILTLVSDEVISNPDGSFTITRVQPGSWVVAGGIDANGDGEYGLGEYFGWYNGGRPINFYKGGTVSGLDFTIMRRSSSFGINEATSQGLPGANVRVIRRGAWGK